MPAMAAGRLLALVAALGVVFFIVLTIVLGVMWAGYDRDSRHAK
ncbi:hypothetical protein [Salinibacterium sp. TMP30]